MANTKDSASSSVRHTLIGVLIVAAIALGLFGPLIGLKTEQNMDNELVLLFRPWHALAAILAAVVGYLIIKAVKAAAEKRAATATTTKPAAAPSALAKVLAPGGLTFVIV